MPKRRHEEAPTKRTEKEVDELLKTKEDLVERLRQLEETEVTWEKMEKAGVRVAERADRFRKSILDVERMLDQAEVAYDEQDEEFEDGFEEAFKRPRVCVYQTGVEPLNRLVTEFVNSAPKSEPKYNALDVNILHRMVRRIQKAGNCPIVDDVVPKDKHLYEHWLTDLVREVNAYTRSCHLETQTYLGSGFDAYDGEAPEDIHGDSEHPDATKRLADDRKATTSSWARAISEAIASGEMSDGDDSGDAVGSADTDDGRVGDDDELESLTGKKDVPSPSGSDMSDLPACASVKRLRLNGGLATSGDDDEDTDVEVIYDGPSPPAKIVNEDADSDVEFIEEVPPTEPKADEDVDASAESVEEVAMSDLQSDAEKSENSGDVVEKGIVAEELPEGTPDAEANGEKENGSAAD